MSDLKLIQLLKDKYNVPINGVDGIQMCHMQLVINTVREYLNTEKQKASSTDEAGANKE